VFVRSRRKRFAASVTRQEVKRSSLIWDNFQSLKEGELIKKFILKIC
jgi:hypothetical protein